MAKFDDLAQYFNPGLELTVLGKDYVIPLPSAELGLWCRTMATTAQLGDDSTDEEMQAAADRLDELPKLPGNRTVEEQLLGSVYQQMMADTVPDPYIQFCAKTVYFWVVGGEELAERYWVSGGRPEAQARGNRASRRANARKTSTGEASATTPQGSGSGTSSRQRSSGRGRGRGSRGQRS